MHPMTTKPQESLRNRLVSPVAPPAATGESQPRISIMIPALALLGYLAFLLTGFGTHLGNLRPLPVYLFFGILLYLFQMQLSRPRTRHQDVGGGSSLTANRFSAHTQVPLSRRLYVLIVSAVALVIAADLVLQISPFGNWSGQPVFYIYINIALYLVFLFEAWSRRRSRRRMAQIDPTELQLSSTEVWAANVSGFALVAFIAAGLVAFLQVSTSPQLILDLNQAFGTRLPAPINTLQDMNLAIGLVATAVSLYLLGISSSVASSATMEQYPETRPGESEVAAATGFTSSFTRIGQATLNEVVVSLFAVLAPLIWIGTAIILALIAQQITDYLQVSQTSAQIIDLFNPFSARSIAHYPQALYTLGLGFIAVCTTILSTIIVEHRLSTIRQALHMLYDAGQTLALSLAFFTLSLVALNAAVIFLRITQVEPFQVGAITLVALLSSIALLLFSLARSRNATPASHTLQHTGDESR